MVSRGGAAVDSRRSWVVAVACFVVQVVTFGLTETQGLLFVAAVTRFDTTRGKASLPFTLAYCVRSAIGPFVGYIGRRFGIRNVTLCGCVMSSLSVAACFFAEDIIEFIVLWGVVFGISLGLETSLLCVIINEHFVKNRVKANGLNVSGASIGVLVLSPVIHFLVEIYGLSGTCLIISGIMLHSIPAAFVMILNKPIPIEERPSSHKHSVSESVRSLSIRSISIPQTPSTLKKKPPMCHDIPEEERRQRKNEENNRLGRNEDSNRLGRNEENNRLGRNEDSNHVAAQTEPATKNTVILSVSELNPKSGSFLSKIFTKKKTYSINSVYNIGECKYTPEDANQRDLNSSLSYDSVFTRRMSFNNYSLKLRNKQSDKSLPRDIIDALSPTNKHTKKEREDKKSKWQVQRLFGDPIYIFIIIGSGIYYFSITSTYTIIIDYAQDIGVPKEYSAYILMWVAISDLVAFPFLGWIIERGYLTQSQYAALSFLGLCLTSQAYVWCSSTGVLLFVVTCFELSQCGVIILTAPLVAEYMDTDLQATGIASVTILSSPITLAISPLVGYFRDNGGSYAGVFYVISAATFLCSVLTACIPRLEQRRKNRRPKRKLGRPLAFAGGH